MSFVESPRFPDGIGYRTVGGPGFRTTVIPTQSGREYRNKKWSQARRRYDVAHAAKLREEIEELYAFFYAVGEGRANGFRFRDVSDFDATASEGVLGAGFGSGVPTYQLKKRYTAGALVHDRDISKPVSGSVVVYRNASPVTVGAGAGQISIATATGIITFVADVSRAISGHTPGASHVFTTAAEITGLIIGSRVYLSGITGTAAATLNGASHEITGKSGAGPYTWTIAAATTGLTASSGTAEKYPQVGDLLTWSGEFDVPVRFDVDEFPVVLEDRDVFGLETLPMIELRV